jgi:hypothetical protein
MSNAARRSLRVAPVATPRRPPGNQSMAKITLNRRRFLIGSAIGSIFGAKAAEVRDGSREHDGARRRARPQR